MALILVVDDEPDMRLALGTVLKKEGHSILEADDGERALEEIAKKPIELVLMDIRLPGMDGVQMLKLVRAQRGDLPVIMVTGYGSVDTAVQVMKLGADAYLSKPFRNRELIETVERVLAARRLSRESRVLHRDLAEKLSGRSIEEETMPMPAPMPWKRLAAAGMIIVALIVALSVAILQRPKTRSYVLPFANATGLAWEGGHLWVTDWLTQSVYELELGADGFQVVRKVTIPKSHMTGLAIVNGEIYDTDGWKNAIEHRKMDAKLTLIGESPAPGTSPAGLFWDGKYLWSCDAASGHIYEHATSDPKLSVVASFPSPGKALVGLYKDDQYLWSADADGRRIYQHRLDAALSVLAQYEVPELNVGSEPLSAVAYKDGNWWAVRDGKAVLLQIPQKSLRKVQ